MSIIKSFNQYKKVNESFMNKSKIVNGDFIMQHKIELPVTGSIIGKMDTVNLAVVRSAQCT
jgi:hypothetical protein